MEQKQKNQKIMLSIIGVAILVIGLVGITYAFFNYIRIGAGNTIRTGRIAFTTSQGTPINLTNMFPIEPTVANLADNTKVGTVTIDVSGDTTYNQGVEYLVTATNVVNKVGSFSTGELSVCNFLFEGTKYANNYTSISDQWLETPRTSDSSSTWFVYATSRFLVYSNTSNSNQTVCPAIDVPYSRIAY